MMETLSGANASPIGRSQQEMMKETAQRVVDRARNQGATAADAFLREDETFSVTVRNGEVEKLKEALSRSLRLRLFLGKRTATAQTSDLSPAVIDRLVDETVEMARLTSEDESGGLPDPSMYPADSPDLQLVDPTWDLIKPEARIDLARRAEAAAFRASSLITNSDGGSFECERSRTVLANTAGFLDGYESTGGYLSAGPIAESNGAMQQDHWFSISRRFDLLESPDMCSTLFQAMRSIAAVPSWWIRSDKVWPALRSRLWMMRGFPAGLVPAPLMMKASPPRSLPLSKTAFFGIISTARTAPAR
jgi:predicted Zn-dependent protease